MNQTFAGVGGPLDCLVAQIIPGILGNDQLNPDVGGLAIGISSENHLSALDLLS